jgi:hypothetical protein
VLSKFIGPRSSDDASKHERRDDRIIGESDYWQEVGNEIERRREVEEQQRD